MEYNTEKIRKKQNATFLKKHPSFCVLAFAHLRVQGLNYADAVPPMRGRAGSLCCSAPNPIQVHLNDNCTDSLDNIIQHEDFKQDREVFYANKLPSQCESACSLDYATLTKREIVNKMHMETILYENIFKKPELKIIDYNFGNECNLSCRMCSAGSSNQIAILASKAKDNTSKLIEFGIINEENIGDGDHVRKGLPANIDAIKKALPNLRELQFAGGEPFVSNDVEDILLEAIKTGANEHIDLEITTNGTKFIEEKLDIFLKFRKINFVVSVDGVGPTYDYIRYPFSFKLLEKRLRDIVDYIVKNKLTGKVIFHFACVGILYNLFDYDKLYNCLKDIFGTVYHKRLVSMEISDVYGNHEDMHALSWNNIPLELLLDALSSYKAQEALTPPDAWYLRFREYVNNRTFMPGEVVNEHLLQGPCAKEHTLLLDKLHDRSYGDFLHPKLVKYLDSIK